MQVLDNEEISLQFEPNKMLSVDGNIQSALSLKGFSQKILGNDQNQEEIKQNGTPNFILNRGDIEKFPTGTMAAHRYILGPTSILDEKQSYETFCWRHKIDNTFLEEKIMIVDDQQINIMAL